MGCPSYQERTPAACPCRLVGQLWRGSIRHQPPDGPEETFVVAQKLLTEERTSPDPLEVIAQSGGVLRVMQHQFSNKAEYEACPECGRKSTVKRQGKSRNGLTVFNCVACERWFVEGLDVGPIPPCPVCLKKTDVQRGRLLTSAAGVAFRLYWCRECGARFRVKERNEI